MSSKIYLNFLQLIDHDHVSIFLRRGTISKHETNVCMYVCPTPDLADFVDLFRGERAKE